MIDPKYIVVEPRSVTCRWFWQRSWVGIVIGSDSCKGYTRSGAIRSTARGYDRTYKEWKKIVV